MHFSELKQLRYGGKWHSYARRARGATERQKERVGEAESEHVERANCRLRCALSLSLFLFLSQQFHKLSASVARNLIQFDLAKFQTHHMISYPLSPCVLANTHTRSAAQ